MNREKEFLSTLNSKNPEIPFLKFYKKALKIETHSDPTAMALAVADLKSNPSLRFVLFKGIEDSKVAFVTNYESRKGRCLSENPKAAVAFYWHKLNMQIRIEGKVVTFSKKESDAYWISRPLKSQISAAVSLQSHTLKTYSELQKLHKEKSSAVKDQGLTNIPRPAYWGGYWIKPLLFEFWFAEENRLHRRVCFERQSFSSQAWTTRVLYP